METQHREETKLTRDDFTLIDNITPMRETLQQVEAVLRRHYEIKDWIGVELILGAAVAHYSIGEMLWLRLIGPSRSGKTELLRGIAEHIDSVKMEVLTPAAIRGGLKKGPKVLDRINGKLVITKDMASMLTSRKEARNEIFGVLRGIKDGYLTSDFGSEEGFLHQKAKFDWILATTEIFEQFRMLESLLGERFIDLRWRPGNREEMAYKAGKNNPYLETVIRPEIASAICSLLSRAAETICEIELSDAEIKNISQYADKAAKIRTPVQRDRYRNLLTYPEPEIGTDLTQGFSRIAKGLKLLGLDYPKYLNRLLWDGMPKTRSMVTNSLVQGDQTQFEIVARTSLSQSNVSYILQDLKMLGVTDNNDNLIMQLTL